MSIHDRHLLTIEDIAEMTGQPVKVMRGIIPGRNVSVIWVRDKPYFHPVDVAFWLDGNDGLGVYYFVPEDDEEPPAPVPVAKPVEPYQRTDGRWSVRLLCPDGVERRFVSQERSPVQPAHHRPSRRLPISAATRFKVLSRDAYTCRYCGRRPPTVVLELDHILAVVDGGTDDLDNLVTACSECNTGKGARASAPPP